MWPLYFIVSSNIAILPYIQTIKQYFDYLLPESKQPEVSGESFNAAGPEASHRFPPILKSERNGNSPISQGFQFHPPENKDSWMHRRSLEGSWSMYPVWSIQGDPEPAMGGWNWVSWSAQVPISLWWAGSTALGYGTFNLFSFWIKCLYNLTFKKWLCLPQHLSLPIRLLKQALAADFSVFLWAPNFLTE